MQATSKLDPRGIFARLLAEALLCVGFAATLLWLTPQVASARSDAAFVWLLAIVLHARVTLRLVEHTVDYLNLDCPTCSYSFHGYPERLPRPLRRCCAHCGSELAQEPHRTA